MTASGTRAYYIGGLVGENWAADITDATASGTVTAPDAYAVGGLASYTGVQQSEPKRVIRNSAATGDVNGTRSVGGLVGTATNDTIVDSHAEGAVSDGLSVGGLIGRNHETQNVGDTVRTLWATGDVTAGNDTGGFVGLNDDDLVVDSYAVGDLEGATKVGGLVGNNTGQAEAIRCSYAAPALPTASGSNLGGRVG